MSNSIITNAGALVALQNLNATNAQLSQTQTRINTGLKISSAKDNGALQTKQQLGIQALSIANQAPQSILSLFK